jgi:hypothetical protein
MESVKMKKVTNKCLNNKLISLKSLFFNYLVHSFNNKSYLIGISYFFAFSGTKKSSIFSKNSKIKKTSVAVEIIQFKYYTFGTVIALLGIIISNNSMATLSATTVKVIHGHEPYLTLDGGVTPITTLNELLSITLSDGSLISPEEDNSSADKPIELPNSINTFNRIQSVIPLPSAGNENYPSVSFDTLIAEPYHYWADSDGDSDAKASGELKVRWENYKNVDITQQVKANPNNALDPCEAPYKLTLSSTDVLLSTKYGDPKTSYFKGASHSYYIKPKIDVPLVCYAQPNLNNGKKEYAGPKEQWDPDNGFKVQSLKNASKNFPTTGANNLSFKLILTGMTAREMIAINSSTVKSVSGSGITLSLMAENGALDSNIVLVTLKGPTKDSSNKTFKPSRFELYRDVKKNLLYQFKIDRWYIVKSGNTDMHYSNAISFCDSLSTLSQKYAVPAIQDYTNANGHGWNLGAPGQGNTYQRRISYFNEYTGKWVGGLFNEWGIIYDYSGTDWLFGDYWVIDTYQESNGEPIKRYNVYAQIGDVDFSFNQGNSDRVACVTW